MDNFSQLASAIGVWVEHLSMPERISLAGGAFFLLATLYREIRERRKEAGQR